ncbi:2059_t:CDS:2, partial [Scutellospora calospora]
MVLSRKHLALMFIVAAFIMIVSATTSFDLSKSEAFQKRQPIPLAGNRKRDDSPTPTETTPTETTPTEITPTETTVSDSAITTTTTSSISTTTIGSTALSHTTLTTTTAITTFNKSYTVFQYTKTTNSKPTVVGDDNQDSNPIYQSSVIVLTAGATESPNTESADQTS